MTLRQHQLEGRRTKVPFVTLFFLGLFEMSLATCAGLVVALMGRAPLDPAAL
ncbi:MAG: hypothetical protein AB3X44_00805 [Leptothrix sp. (in: b-proteobacteria)]